MRPVSSARKTSRSFVWQAAGRTWRSTSKHGKFIKVWPEIVKNAAAREATVFEVQAGVGLKIEVYSLTRQVGKK